jgi:uncharacterized protein (UPF0335 family)
MSVPSAQTAELASQIDVLEAEKVALQKSHDDVVAEFEAFKNDLEQKAAVEARKADRTQRVKAANANLADTYFTEERIQRWAQMPDEAFDALVADLTESAPAPGEQRVEQQARETAAFTGGTAPTASEGSLLGAFLTRTGKLPAASA